MTSLQEMVQLIKSESERLKQYVSVLPPDVLDQPSPCEGWSVGDVIAHLVWFAEIYGGMMERGIRGDVSAPEGFPPPGTLAGPAIDQLYGQAATARRRDLCKHLLPTFNRRYDHLNDLLAGLGAQDWDKPCYHTLRVRPVHSFLPTIIQELAVHEWDIRSRLEPSPSLSAESIPVLMEKLPSNRRPWTLPFPTTPTSSGPLRYGFNLKGPVAGRLNVVADGGKCRMEAPGEVPASTDLSGDTETFVLLMYGRLTLDSAITAGRFKAEGDLGLVPDFDRWLKEH